MHTGATGIERRLAPRTAVTLPAEIRYEGLDCTGFVADISRSGAFLRASDQADPLLGLLAVGDCLELLIAPEGTRTLVIPARVVHRRSHGIGVEFGKERDPASTTPAEKSHPRS